MYMPWSEVLEIGVPTVDGEHRHLAAVVNGFHDLYRAGAARDKIFQVLNLLAKYVEVHFRSEEMLMEAGRYPELLKHRREHDKLAEQIFSLAERYEAGDAEITQEVMEFLKGWLLDHILHTDKKLEPFFQARGIPPGWEKPNALPPAGAVAQAAMGGFG